jgi:hypothetical protein
MIVKRHPLAGLVKLAKEWQPDLARAEIGGPKSWQLTFERLACTLAGGGLALLAAHIFWPAWEKDRFQPLMSQALLAGREYIKLLCHRLREGTGRGPELIPAKKKSRNSPGELRTFGV